MRRWTAKMVIGSVNMRKMRRWEREAFSVVWSWSTGGKVGTDLVC